MAEGALPSVTQRKKNGCEPRAAMPDLMPDAWQRLEKQSKRPRWFARATWACVCCMERRSPMQMTCYQRDLVSMLRLIRHATTTRSTLPMLSHVLLATEDTSRLRLCATNLTLGIVAQVEAEVEQSGAIAVPARSLLTCIEGYPQDSRITLRTQEAKDASGSTVAHLV